MPASARVGWGWHRLTDSWADTIVAEAGIRPGELVVDVGAGTGVLTAALVRAGARVIAVELHPDRVANLRRRFDVHVRVVRVDASDLRLPRRPFRVVANPPFAVTAQLVRRLLAPGSRLVGADLVLQRAAARRWVDGEARGRNRWQRDYALHLGRRVPRTAFTPRPAVDATMLVVRRRSYTDR